MAKTAKECVCPRYEGPSKFAQYMQARRDADPTAAGRVVWCACMGWRDNAGTVNA
jgi:hypothetical protein